MVRKSALYPKQMSRLVISIRRDMDPSNILENIEDIDLEIDRTERNIPSNLSENDMNDINILIQANKDLREKVNDVSELVKETLTKINHKDTKEVREEDPELIDKKNEIASMHLKMRHKRKITVTLIARLPMNIGRKKENLKMRINNTPKDPRTDDMLEAIKKLDSENFELNEEIKLLSKTAKTQFGTIKRKNDNPQIDERLEILRTEFVQTKQLAKEKEKEAKDIIFNNNLQTEELLRVQEEWRKIKEKNFLISNNLPTKEIQLVKQLKNDEVNAQDKQEQLKKQFEAEDALHKKNIKMFDKDIKSKEAQIQAIKQKIDAYSKENNILAGEVKELREMAKDLIKPKSQMNG